MTEDTNFNLTLTHLYQNDWDEEEGEENGEPHLVGQRVIETEKLWLEYGLGHTEGRGGILVGVREVVPLEALRQNSVDDRGHERLMLLNLLRHLRKDTWGKHSFALHQEPKGPFCFIKRK